MESDFKKWNEAIATKLKLRELSADEIKKLSQAEEFDEVWEQVVFRICEKDTFLSNRVSQISQLLNIIAALIPEGKNLGEVIEEVLELSAVTDIQAFDKPKQAINKGPVLKTLGSNKRVNIRYNNGSVPSSVNILKGGIISNNII
jgi:hypothetical protein